MNFNKRIESVSEERIFQIETAETFGEFTVKRANIDELEVIHNGAVIFKGEDFEVADFINDSSKK